MPLSIQELWDVFLSGPWHTSEKDVQSGKKHEGCVISGAERPSAGDAEGDAVRNSNPSCNSCPAWQLQVFRCAALGHWGSRSRAWGFITAGGRTQPWGLQAWRLPWLAEVEGHKAASLLPGMSGEPGRPSLPSCTCDVLEQQQQVSYL